MYASISCTLFHASLAFMHKFYLKKKKKKKSSSELCSSQDKPAAPTSEASWAVFMLVKLKLNSPPND